MQKDVSVQEQTVVFFTRRIEAAPCDAVGFQPPIALGCCTVAPAGRHR